VTLVNSLAGLLAMAGVEAPASPPPAVIALVAALESGDLSAARATLAEDATIADSSSGRGAESSLAALAEYARGCARTDLTWEYDSQERHRAAATITWRCPSRAPNQAMIWTAGPRVVWVQFGLPGPEISQ